jgi:hypothetical protein
MPRPRTYDEPRVATAVRLPESIHRRLHDAASDRDVSANLLVIRAVRELLDRLPAATADLDLDTRPARRSRTVRGARS